MKSRELPTFEVHGTEEFYVFRNFFLTTAVLPLRVERKDPYNGNAIIFYVLNETDRIKALGNLKKLYNIFNDYKHVIIKEFGS
jgi:hypothetical protein